MKNIENKIETFEKIMDKASMPVVLLGSAFLIGRALLSFIFGI